jgi:hypothetical protein
MIMKVYAIVWYISVYIKINYYKKILWQYVNTLVHFYNSQEEQKSSRED